MSLRSKLWIWALTLYLAAGFAGYQLLAVNKWYFVAVEAGLVASLFVFFWFQQSLLKPIKTISEGVKMLQEQDFNTRLISVGQVEIDRLTSVYNNMVDALRQERVKQEEAHFFLNKLIEASPQGILILNFDGCIAEANPSALNFLHLSLEQAVGQPLSALPGDWATLVAEAREHGPTLARTPSGRSIRVEVATFIDRGFERPFVTIEEQTQEVMTLERQAYEKVIRMMSHEVNNSAGAINSMLTSLLSQCPTLPYSEQHDFRSALEVSIARNNSLSAFMSNLASVVKLPKPAKTQIDMNHVAESVVRLMQQRAMDSGTSIECHFCPNPLTVLADQTQMEQVLLNVIKNAIEAIGTNGTIWVTTTHEPPSITIANNGEPLPNRHARAAQQVQKSLFTPFFSTKPNGQGVGLTLAREVLLNHGFSFSLQTLNTGITEFKITFG